MNRKMSLKNVVVKAVVALVMVVGVLGASTGCDPEIENAFWTGFEAGYNNPSLVDSGSSYWGSGW